LYRKSVNKKVVLPFITFILREVEIYSRKTLII